jgi:hypothetical protein
VGASCDAPAQYGDINVTSQIEASDGLDLRAVGALVKEAESAQDLERRLNREGGINNLDLNADGKVDFIHVTEYGGEQAKGFSLTVQPAEGETQEVATIEIEKSASEAGAGEPAQQKADVYVRGNDQIYGSQHHHYHSSYPIGSMLLMAYLFRPHPFYVSPFGFGYYPPYYGGGYSRVSRTTYATRAAGAAAGSTPRAVSGRASSLRSPNAGKVASRGVRASLRNPTQSQRSFQARTARGVNSRGFAERVQSRASSRRAPAKSAAPRRSFGRSRGFSRGFSSRGFRSRR